MAVRKKPLSLTQFQRRFADDARCAELLFRRRWPDGFVCPACGGGRAHLLRSRAFTYECAGCGRQTSVTAGTVMHRSKLPLRLWFWAAHLMATHSNGISALQLQAQLGVTYKTAWLLGHKLRLAMVDPDRGKLGGVVEVDQTEMPLRTKEALEGDPKAMKKIIVVGAVEVRAYKPGKRPRKSLLSYGDKLSGRCRLARISANTEKEIRAFMRANIEPGTTVVTDGHESYAWINREALAAIERTGQEVRPEYVHEPHVVRKIAAHLVLPWIHRVFSLMMRWSMGTYHGLRRQHVDAYLNEFVFRYNRRHLRRISFDVILGLAAHHAPTTYWDTTGAPRRPREKPPMRQRPQRRRTVTWLTEGQKDTGPAT